MLATAHQNMQESRLCVDCAKLQAQPAQTTRLFGDFWYREERYTHKSSVQHLLNSAEAGCRFCGLLVSSLREETNTRNRSDSWDKLIHDEKLCVRCVWELQPREPGIPSQLAVAVCESRIPFPPHAQSEAYLTLLPFLNRGQPDDRSLTHIS